MPLSIPPYSLRKSALAAAVACAMLILPRLACGVERMVFQRGAQKITAEGKALVEAQDGGVLFQGEDGVLWAVQPDEIVSRGKNDRPFRPLSREQLAKRLLAEMPKGFRIHNTANYLICYNTSRAYAQWCGSLYERLYRGFTNYWSQRGVELEDPSQPLVALVFDSKASYARYAQHELGKATDSIIGYYSLRTNRVVMFDLTGVETAGRTASTSATQINRVLAQPQAAPMVATIIHEATHQLAFNCGMQQRYADVPLWLSEGMALYFETPDLSRRKGWSTIGAVNRVRLVRFRQGLKTRPANSLTTLLQDDKRFRDPKQAIDAYAEAWALTYYLLKHHPKKYVAYLEQAASLKPLSQLSPEERLAKFKAAFGEDLSALEADFLRQLRRVR